MNRIKLIIPLVLVSMASGFFGGAVSLKYLDNSQEKVAGDGQNYITKVVEESEVTDAIDKVAPSVVSVVALKDVPVSRTYSIGNGFFNIVGQQPDNVEYNYQEVSGGTGYIVDESGLVLTNRHVVQDEEADYKVVLSDGAEYSGEVLSRDLFDDVAALKIIIPEGEEAKFPFVKFGDSDNLKVGQTVVAIGNALAQYNNTATEGIISAKGRDVAAYNEGAGLTQNLSGLLQTDAAINFGNSGGPLVNMEGEVIGMNTAIADTANGIGFAIPSNDLKPILASIEQYGEIVRPVLGVRFVMLTNDDAKEISEDLTAGALLVADELNKDVESIVPGGAAEEAGLQDMDVILQVDDQEVTLDNPLQRIIRSHAVGDKIKLKVWREGKEMEVDVTLKSSKELTE